MHAAISDHKAEIATLCRAFGVRRLEVFGSAARATDFDPEKSDADFLVEFDREGDRDPLPQFFGFADALRGVLGRPVDLIENGPIANPYLRASMNKDREFVYAA